jgi:hypothetical protein
MRRAAPGIRTLARAAWSQFLTATKASSTRTEFLISVWIPLEDEARLALLFGASEAFCAKE